MSYSTLGEKQRQTLQLSSLHIRPYMTWSVAPLLWAAGAVESIVSGIRHRSVFLRLAGISFLAIASLFVAWAYGRATPDACVLFLNLRFLAALAAVLAFFIWGRCLNRYHSL